MPDLLQFLQIYCLNTFVNKKIASFRVFCGIPRAWGNLPINSIYYNVSPDKDKLCTYLHITFKPNGKEILFHKGPRNKLKFKQVYKSSMHHCWSVADQRAFLLNPSVPSSMHHTFVNAFMGTPSALGNIVGV